MPQARPGRGGTAPPGQPPDPGPWPDRRAPANERQPRARAAASNEPPATSRPAPCHIRSSPASTGRNASTRSSASTASRRRCATPSPAAASRIPTSLQDHAASGRRRRPGSWQRRSTASMAPPWTPAARAMPASRSPRAATSTSSKSMARPIPGLTTFGMSSSQGLPNPSGPGPIQDLHHRRGASLLCLRPSTPC